MDVARLQTREIKQNEGRMPDLLKAQYILAALMS